MGSFFFRNEINLYYEEVRPMFEAIVKIVLWDLVPLLTALGIMYLIEKQL